MKNPTNEPLSPRHAHLSAALEHARRLSEEPRPDGNYNAGWSANAAQVGDLSVLALRD